MAIFFEQLLGRRRRQAGEPAIICGTLSPGERVDIGSLRIVNDYGDLRWAARCQTNALACGLSLDGQLTITGLDGHDDEGVCLGRPAAGSSRRSFVANVRPERAVQFTPTPEPSIPLVSLGQGDYRRDWPGDVAGSREPVAGERQDQASGLRAAMADGGAA